jgi:hypothetical protein
MCSPLGVRTSFACRLPFERPLAAVRELEVDAGIRISYANRRTGEPANRRTGEPANRQVSSAFPRPCRALAFTAARPAFSRTISIWRQETWAFQCVAASVVVVVISLLWSVVPCNGVVGDWPYERPSTLRAFVRRNFGHTSSLNPTLIISVMIRSRESPIGKYPA